MNSSHVYPSWIHVDRCWLMKVLLNSSGIRPTAVSMKCLRRTSCSAISVMVNSASSLAIIKITYFAISSPGAGSGILFTFSTISVILLLQYGSTRDLSSTDGHPAFHSKKMSTSTNCKFRFRTTSGELTTPTLITARLTTPVDL